MQKISDFSQPKWEDCIVNVNIDPPLPIGGWNIRFQVTKRFGGESGLITKSVASGFNGSSGITIVSSGQGQFQTTINSVDTSGLQFGPYAYTFQRLDSGSRVCLVEGFFNITPNTLG